jgi:histidine triad (HIT) family protein
MENCIFCKIVKGEIPGEIVYEDEAILAFEDINPVAPVHILVIPKAHIENILELDEKNVEVIASIHLGVKKIAAHKGLEQFRFITNCGEDAGQTVFHLHYHMIGGKTLGDLLPKG